MPRPQPVFLALALLLTAVPVAHAQLGGLKKKVADKVTGRDTVAVAGTAKPKCDASSMVITNDVVDRYIKSMAARDAQMEKLAKEPGKTGAYYAAVLKQQAVRRRKAEYDLHKGPDWEKHKVLQKRLMSEVMSAKDATPTIKENDALTESLNPSRVEIPEIDWETQKKGNARIDSTMMVAGGFSACDWKDLGEKMPRLVGTLANDPNTKDLQGFGTAKDAAVIRPRLAELTRAMGMEYVSPEDKVRLEADRKAEQEEAAKPPSSGNPQTDCMMAAQVKWQKAHQPELEAASKAKDMNAIMRLNGELSAEMAKCSPSEE
jgi:hypothetical protein